MRTLYATQFTVLTRTEDDGRRPVESLLNEIKSWIKRHYPPDIREDLLSFDGVERQPETGHSLKGQRDVTPGHALISVAWSFPNDRDSSLLWCVEIRLAMSRGGEVEVSIAIRISSVAFSVRPLQFDLRRPAIVPTLLSRFRCRSGGLELGDRPLVVKAGEVLALVDEKLLSAERVLPIVLVSC